MRRSARFIKPILEILEDRTLLDGALDITFGDRGLVTTNFIIPDFPNVAINVVGAALQPDGKVIVAGSADMGFGSHAIALARYLNDGSLDPTFGGRPALGGLAGRVLHNESAGLPTLARAEDVAMQPDGKIVVVGTSRARGIVDYPEVLVVRYNADGSVDDGSPSDSTPGDHFGVGGIATVRLHSQTISVGAQATGKAVAIDTLGHIVVAASGFDADHYFQSLLRFNPDGGLDSSFGIGDGRLDFNVPGPSIPGFVTAFTFETPVDLAIQPDGKYVVAGQGSYLGVTYFTATRFIADPVFPADAFDTAFGERGRVITEFGTSGATPTAAAIHLDGDLIMGGFVTGAPVTGTNFAAARFEINQPLVPDGMLSPSFGPSALPGRVTADFHSIGSPFQRTEDFAYAVAVQPDGKILLAGNTLEISEFNPSATSEFAILRLNTDGVRDVTFGTEGWVTTDFSMREDRAKAMLLTPDGKLVVAGMSNNDMALARYVLEPGNRDGDGDGVLDDVENARPNGRDGNGDTTPDASQADVASLPNRVDDHYVTIQSRNGFLREVQTATFTEPLADAARPLGDFSVRIENIGTRASVAVDFYLPSGVTADAFFQFGPSANDRVDHWSEIVADASAPAGVLRVNLTDGGPGDNDGLANGVIVVAGGPARDLGDPALLSITGTKFHDVNGDGVRDPGIGVEPGLSGWTIYLDENANGIFDAGEPWSLTDASGHYAFRNDDTLPPGAFIQEESNGGLIARVNLERRSYVVAELLQPGWINTLPSPFQLLDLAGTPSSVDTKDMDGDGDLDLVVGASASDPNAANRTDIFVFYNRGDGSFAPGLRIQADTTPEIDVYDFNSDGRFDIVGLGSTGNLFLFLGAASGGFETPRSLNIGGRGNRLVLGDVDGDGRSDDLVTGNLDGTVSTLLWDEMTKTFLPARFANVGVTDALGNALGVDALAVGQFTRDGNLDIAALVHTPGAGTDTIRILLGDSLGGFTADQEFTAVSWTRSLVVGQFNPSQDNAPDLAIVDNAAGTIQLFLGAFAMPFTLGPALDVGPNPFQALVTDLDGDGNDDLVVNHGSTGSAELTLLSNQEDGTFAISSRIVHGPYPNLLGAALLDGDAQQDFLLSGPNDEALAVAPTLLTAAQRVRLGNRAIATNVDFGNQSLSSGAIRGNVFVDDDGDGFRDAGESPRPGTRIVLDRNGNALFDPGIDQTMFTDADGNYAFENLPAADYAVIPVVPADHELTKPAAGAYVIQLPDGAVFANRDFGMRPFPGTIRGTVWEDLNGDGIHDGNEPPLPGVIVFLDGNGNHLPDSNELRVTSASDGSYEFANLPSQRSYVVRQLVPTGFGQTFPDRELSTAHEVFLDVGATVIANFGNGRLATVRGTKWTDTNDNSIPDPGEPRGAGVTVWVDLNRNGQPDLGEPSAVTELDGSYTLFNVPPGSVLISSNASVAYMGPANSANFGFSVASEGGRIVVGDPSYSDTGAFHVIDAMTGALTSHFGEQPFPPLDPQFLLGYLAELFGFGVISAESLESFRSRNLLPDTLGFSVAATPNTVVGTSFGLEGQGAARGFFGSNGTFFGSFGLFSSPWEGDGLPGSDGIVTASPDGRIRVYRDSGDMLVQISSLDTGLRIESIAGAGQGKIVIGSPETEEAGLPVSGVAFLYDISTNAIVGSFHHPVPAAGNNFGSAVAGYGTNVVVAAPGEDAGATDAGAVYVFDSATGALRFTLQNPTHAANDHFGFAVATVGNFISVGAPSDDTFGTDAGAVYLFDGFTGHYLRTFSSPNPAPGANFGFSLAALGDNRLLVGAPSISSADPGAVYVFDAGQRIALVSAENRGGVDFRTVVRRDYDGIPDAVENAAPNNGDGNNDGILDAEQLNVASLPNAVTDRHVTIVAPPSTRLVDVSAETVPAGGGPAGVGFPVGFFSFTVEGVPTNGAAVVELIFAQEIAVDSYFKTAAPPFFSTFLWDGSANGVGAELIDSDQNGLINRIRLHLRDGALGDHDFQGNGRIVDPGGPATFQVATQPDAYSVAEDKVLVVPAPGLIANDNSAAGHALTAAFVHGPVHGHLTLNADGSFRYQPNPDFSGTDTFVYRAADGPVLSAETLVTITVTPVIDAKIDVKPGSSRNRINLRSHGLLAVAILSTQRARGEKEDFDARTVDVRTIRFGDPRVSARVAPVHWLFKDVDRDGDLDLVVYFSIPDINRSGALLSDSTTAQLSALALTDAGLVPVEGADAVSIVPRHASRMHHNRCRLLPKDRTAVIEAFFGRRRGTRPSE